MDVVVFPQSDLYCCSPPNKKDPGSLAAGCLCVTRYLGAPDAVHEAVTWSSPWRTGAVRNSFKQEYFTHWLKITERCGKEMTKSQRPADPDVCFLLTVWASLASLSS